MNPKVHFGGMQDERIWTGFPWYKPNNRCWGRLWKEQN